MSYIGIIISSVFASNAVFRYGLASHAGRRRGPGEGIQEPGTGIPAAIALILIDLTASLFLWCLRRFALVPFGLASLDILFYVLVAAPAVKAISKRASSSRSPFIASVGAAGNEIVIGSLSFGIALLATRSGYGLPEALVASAGSGFGYWIAVNLLDCLSARLERSDLPRPFRGPPAMLISAGLMAMALMGIDAVFVKNVVG